MTTNFDVGSQDSLLYGVGIEFESTAVSGGQVRMRIVCSADRIISILW